MVRMDRKENFVFLDSTFLAVDETNMSISELTNTFNSTPNESESPSFGGNELMDCSTSNSNATSAAHSALREKRTLQSTSSTNIGHVQKISRNYVSASTFFLLLLLHYICSYSYFISLYSRI